MLLLESLALRHVPPAESPIRFVFGLPADEGRPGAIGSMRASKVSEVRTVPAHCVRSFLSADLFDNESADP